MNLSPKIEAKLRELANKKGWSEVEFVIKREQFINWAIIGEEFIKHNIKKRLNK